MLVHLQQLHCDINVQFLSKFCLKEFCTVDFKLQDYNNMFCSFVDVTILVNHTGQKLKVTDFRYAIKLENDEMINIHDDHKFYNVHFTAPEVCSLYL